MVRFLLEAFRAATRPQEELVQAVRLLVLPMLEASYDAGQAVVDEQMLQAIITDMFDPPDELVGAPTLRRHPGGPGSGAEAVLGRAVCGLQSCVRPAFQWRNCLSYAALLLIRPSSREVRQQHVRNAGWWPCCAS